MLRAIPVKAFEFVGPDKRHRQAVPGVPIALAVIGEAKARRYAERGLVTLAEGPVQAPPPGPAAGAAGPRVALIPPARPRADTLRVGIWLVTSPYYSGGRLMMYGYAHGLARAGAEVWLFTDREPIWAADYPPLGNLNVALIDRVQPPPDLDLIVTDNKAALGKAAWAVRQAQPRAKFVCVSFETANWVERYSTDYAKLFDERQAAESFPRADLALAISQEGEQYLREWLESLNPYGPCPALDVLTPGLNTYAMDACDRPALLDQRPDPDRPYMVWCARTHRHKGGMLPIEAVFTCGVPMDLYAVGFDLPGQNDYSEHVYRRLDSRSGKAVPDAEKFGLFRHARAVLAPSLFEGYGMVPGEALCVGTPSIVYDLPVLRESYGDKLTYVPRGDAAAFRAAVKTAATTPKPAIDWQRERAVYGGQAAALRAERLPYHSVRRPRTSALMVCYATPTAVAAVQAVYDFVDEVVIAYGPTPEWRACPEGGVLDDLRAMPDPCRKVRIEARQEWPDKEALRRWTYEAMTGRYAMVLDADEIWTGLDVWLLRGPRRGSPRWINLWHGPDHWIHGQRFGRTLDDGAPGSVCPHYRWSWWRPSYQLKHHAMPVDVEGHSAVTLHDHEHAAGLCPETAIYHLGHALPADLMNWKHAYYQARDRGDGPDLARAAWENWTGATGPLDDGTTVEAISWPLPDVVLGALAAVAQRSERCQQ